MQTMTFYRAQAAVGAIMFICSIATVIVALLSLAGVTSGLLCVLPFGLMYLFISLLRLLKELEGKQKAPGRAARPGA
jgi:hypothetical protein